MFAALGICLIFVFNGVNGIEEMLSDKLVVNMNLLIKYLSDNPSEFDWDTALFGRIAADQFNALLNEIKTKCDITVPDFLKGVEILKNLSADLTVLVDKAIVSFSTAKPDMFKMIEFILKTNFWNVYKPSKDVSRQFAYPADKLNPLEISIDSSVACLREWTEKKCQAGDFCWDLLTGEKHTKRYILHEIVYILAGELAGCSAQIEKRAQAQNKTATVLLKEFCSNAWLEYEKVIVAAKGFTFKGDILQKMGFCGVAGYHHFFPDEWIVWLTALQNPAGYYVMCNGQELNAAVAEKNQLLVELCQQTLNSRALLALQQAIRYSLEPDLYISCERWVISH